MTSKLKLALVVWCLGALTAPVAMANTKEFVAETPNVPQLSKPQVAPLNNIPFSVPEPGSLPLALMAVAAAVALARRKK